MKWYRVAVWTDAVEVEEVNVVRHTDHSVWVDWRGIVGRRPRQKSATGPSYFPSQAAAFEWGAKVLQGRIDDALARVQQTLALIERMQAAKKTAMREVQP